MKSNLSERKPKIRKYNPGSLNDEEIEATFVARKETFEVILREIVGSPAIPQHHLIVGQRGMGKTTLLLRLAAELRKPIYSDRFLPLEFPEEQYYEVDRLSRFWLNCLDGVADALEQRGMSKEANELDQRIRKLDRSKVHEDELSEATRKLFQESFEGCGLRLVLLIDNFDLLLGKLKKNSDFDLRSFFMQRDAPILVGGSVVVPEETMDYGAALYDAFKIRVLHRLTLEEMREILIHLSELANRKELVSRIQQEMPRLKALRNLTGGNPRTTVLLFKLFAEGFSDDIWDDLETLLDEVTPIYQSRFEQLSDQGQLVVGALARSWSPVSRSVLLEKTNIAAGSFSPQMQRLEELGIVETVPLSTTKRNGYQIAERFLNIWYLMRFAPRRQRSSLVCLTKFLQTFYEPSELRKFAVDLTERDFLHGGEVSYAMALAEAENLSERDRRQLRYHAEVSALSESELTVADESFDDSEIFPEAKEHVALWKRLKSKANGIPNLDGAHFAKLVLGSFCLFLSPGSREAIAESSLSERQMLELVGWLERELAGNDRVFGVPGLVNLRRILWLGRVRQLPSVDQTWGDVVQLLSQKLSSAVKLEKTLSRLVELNPKVAEFWNARGMLLSDQPDRMKESEADYRKSVELDSQYAWALNNLGNLLSKQSEQVEEAEVCFRKSIELFSNPAMAWSNFGNLLCSQSARMEESEACYRKSIELDPQLPIPRNNLGSLLFEFGRFDESENNFRKSIDLDPKSSMPWNNLGHLMLDYLDNPLEARRCYEKAIEFGSDNPWIMQRLAFVIRDVCDDIAEAVRVVDLIKSKTPTSLEFLEDSIALQDAVFASRAENWGEAAEHLTKALNIVGSEIPSYSREYWYFATAALLHQGYGSKLMRLLEEGGWDEMFLPWYEAIQAHVKETRDYLIDIPMEAREVAEEIYDEIARRKNWLPDSTRNIANS